MSYKIKRKPQRETREDSYKIEKEQNASDDFYETDDKI